MFATSEALANLAGTRSASLSSAAGGMFIILCFNVRFMVPVRYWYQMGCYQCFCCISKLLIKFFVACASYRIVVLGSPVSVVHFGI
jgi:hypothetical protein